FWLYLGKVLRGDFGNSVLTTNPVLDDIRRFFPATLELATLGTLIGTLVGVPLGVLAAVRAGSLTDQVTRVVGLVGYS
ncbi:ABC transporter permease, partial [Salmonella enterica subsp. enterica serovar Oranienburg]|nr:ABC transporter permease [Salmonella enterica subsp. enterica serovar Oranienburg]